MTKNVLILAVIAVFITAITVGDLVTGRLRLGEYGVIKTITRDQQPFLYWAWIVVFSGLTGFLWYYVAIGISVLDAQP